MRHVLNGSNGSCRDRPARGLAMAIVEPVDQGADCRGPQEPAHTTSLPLTCASATVAKVSASSWRITAAIGCAPGGEPSVGHGHRAPGTGRSLITIESSPIASQIFQLHVRESPLSLRVVSRRFSASATAAGSRSTRRSVEEPTLRVHAGRLLDFVIGCNAEVPVGATPALAPPLRVWAPRSSRPAELNSGLGAAPLKPWIPIPYSLHSYTTRAPAPYRTTRNVTPPFLAPAGVPLGSSSRVYRLADPA